MSTDHLAHDDPLVSGFDRRARARLARRLADVVGKTPLAYVQDLRVEHAVHLLRTSDQPVEKIAGQVGYRDGVTLRTLLRKRLGKGIRELRGYRGAEG